MDTQAAVNPATRPHRASERHPGGFCATPEHLWDGRGPVEAMRDARLCARHAAELEAAPRRIATYHVLLEDGFALTKKGDNLGRRSSSHPGLPVLDDVWTIRHTALTTVRSWSGWVRQHLGESPPAPTTVDSLTTHAAYLSAALGQCLQADWIGEAVDELLFIAYRLENALDGEPVT